MKDDRTYPALVLRWGDDFVCVRCGSRRWQAFIVYDNRRELWSNLQGYEYGGYRSSVERRMSPYRGVEVFAGHVWCEDCDGWTEIVAPEHKEGGES